MANSPFYSNFHPEGTFFCLWVRKSSLWETFFCIQVRKSPLKDTFFYLIVRKSSLWETFFYVWVRKCSLWKTFSSLKLSTSSLRETFLYFRVRKPRNGTHVGLCKRAQRFCQGVSFPRNEPNHFRCTSLLDTSSCCRAIPPDFGLRNNSVYFLTFFFSNSSSSSGYNFAAQSGHMPWENWASEWFWI